MGSDSAVKAFNILQSQAKPEKGKEAQLLQL